MRVAWNAGLRAISLSLAVFICALSFVGEGAVAQTQTTRRFSDGAALKEVLAAWGEPDERIVKGVKHELVWAYAGGARVTFKDGYVVSYRSSDFLQDQNAKKAAAAVAESKRLAAVSSESKDLLRDIVREIPSGADGPSLPDAGHSSDPNLQGLIPNAVPGRNGPAAIAPSIVIPGSEDEQ